MSLITKFTVFEDNAAALMARITGVDGSNITQADVTSIAYSVYALEDPSTEVSSGTLTVADVVFDTLQTDDRWTEDITGYNFRWSAPASTFPKGGKQYRVEILFTPVSGTADNYHLVYEASTVQLLRT